MLLPGEIKIVSFNFIYREGRTASDLFREE
jgi:hypothetical protein